MMQLARYTGITRERLYKAWASKASAGLAVQCGGANGAGVVSKRVRNRKDPFSGALSAHESINSGVNSWIFVANNFN